MSNPGSDTYLQSVHLLLYLKIISMKCLLYIFLNVLFCNILDGWTFRKGPVSAWKYLIFYTCTGVFASRKWLQYWCDILYIDMRFCWHDVTAVEIAIWYCIIQFHASPLPDQFLMKRTAGFFELKIFSILDIVGISSVNRFDLFYGTPVQLT